MYKGKYLMAFAIIAVSSSQVSATNACKGLAESACLDQSQCSWVASYVRSDQKTVKAYCRKNRTSTSGDKLTKAVNQAD